MLTGGPGGSVMCSQHISMWTERSEAKVIIHSAHSGIHSSIGLIKQLPRCRKAVIRQEVTLLPLSCVRFSQEAKGGWQTSSLETPPLPAALY
jgi:hypothetical protein